MKRFFLICSFLLVGWIVFAQGFMKMRTSDEDAKVTFQLAGVELTTDTIMTDGNILHYAKTGSDVLPTLFFIHGSPGSWSAFEEYLKDSSLLKKYRMVAIDRPGFGYSDFGKAKNLQQQTEIISPLLRRLKNGKPLFIIGHSLGGPLSCKLTAENGELVSGLVVLAGSVSKKDEPKEGWRAVLKVFPLKYLVPGALRPSNAEIWMAKKELVGLSEQFKLITCPVWIVHGDHDDLVPVENAYYLQKMLVNSSKVELTIIPGAPHYLPWDPYFDDVKDVLIKLN